MSDAAKPIHLPEDLQAFAEARVRAGQFASVEAVVFDALEEKKRELLREAIEVGIADAEAGKVIEGTPREIMDRVHQRHGLARGK